MLKFTVISVFNSKSERIEEAQIFQVDFISEAQPGIIKVEAGL